MKFVYFGCRRGVSGGRLYPGKLAGRMRAAE